MVPVRWTLDDRREATPPLFPAPPRTTRRKRQPRRTAATPARNAATAADELPLKVEGHTVAELTGAGADDPDATEAMPWMPVFDAGDDLDGLLRADSPLLSRAFHGPARRR
jgi:hypothetical protein